MATEKMPEGTLNLFKDEKAISRYVDILTNRGNEWGLLGPSENDRIWSRHILNCAVLVDFIPANAKVADVGSGAGLPGLVIAIARDDIDVTLIESLERRAKFLELAIDELGLADRVRVIRGRSEDVQEKFDVVTARAVAALPKLLGFTCDLFLPKGQLIALKGKNASVEVEKSRAKLKKLRASAEIIEVHALANSEPTWIVRVTSKEK